MVNTGVLELLITLFFIVIVIPWVLLPFALFGIKPLLREILAEMRDAKEVSHRSDGRDAASARASDPAGIPHT